MSDKYMVMFDGPGLGNFRYEFSILPQIILTFGGSGWFGAGLYVGWLFWGIYIHVEER